MLQLTKAMQLKLPSLGLKLNTTDAWAWAGLKSLETKYSKETSPNFYKIVRCEYCGLIEIKPISTIRFCSVTCAARYLGEQKHRNCLKNAIKIVSNSELKAFLKDYSNFVYSEIYNYPSEVREDLIDFWNEKSITILAKLKKLKIEKKRIIMKYLKKCIKNVSLNLIKNKQKEVFYDELSYYNYSYILGEDKRERY